MKNVSKIKSILPFYSAVNIKELIPGAKGIASCNPAASICLPLNAEGRGIARPYLVIQELGKRSGRKISNWIPVPNLQTGKHNFLSRNCGTDCNCLSRILLCVPGLHVIHTHTQTHKYMFETQSVYTYVILEL